MSKPPVVVLGMFKGGTSVVSKVLSELGVNMGGVGHVVAGGSYYTYEDPRIRKIMTHFFRDNASTREGVAGFEQHLRGYMDGRKSESEGRRWGVKHPLLCVAVEYLYLALGTEWQAVCVDRAINAIMPSLRKTAWLTFDEGTTRAIYAARDRGLKDHDRDLLTHISHDKLIQNPERVIGQLAHRVGLPVTPARLKEIAKLVVRRKHD